MSGKTRIRSTAKQLKLLVDYMTTHPKLAHGEYSGPQGRLLETRQWEELRAILSEYGPDKSVDQWKVSWRDLRRKARAEGSYVNRASFATGNAVEIPALSDINKKILEVMGTEGFGIQGGEESGVGSATNLSTFDPTQLVTFDEVVGPSNVTNEEVFVETIQQDSSQTSIAGSSQQQHTQRVQAIQQDFSQTSVAGSTQQQHPQRVRPLQRQQRRQRQRQLERARSNQFLEAELESNKILRDIANQLAIANTHSAIRSRSAFREKLWRLRRDLFK